MIKTLKESSTKWENLIKAKKGPCEWKQTNNSRKKMLKNYSPKCLIQRAEGRKIYKNKNKPQCLKQAKKKCTSCENICRSMKLLLLQF